MNDRIQKLAEQAGMYVDLTGKPWPKCMSAEEAVAAYEKFAQLIVHDILDQLTNDDALGAARIETIRGLALRYGVAR